MSNPIFMRALAVFISICVAGCTSSIDIDNKNIDRKLIEQDKKDQFQPVTRTSYLKRYSAEDENSTKYVKYSIESGKLINALTEPDILKGYELVPRDFGVDLNASVNVRADNMLLKDYLDYLAAQTGYDIKINGRVINVQSFIIDSWNLASFSDRRTVNNKSSGGQKTGGNGNNGNGQDGNQRGNSESSSGDDQSTVTTVGMEFSDDDWDILLKGARDIMGAKQSIGQDSSKGNSRAAGIPQDLILGGQEAQGKDSVYKDMQDSELKKPREAFVHGVRSAGIITAGGAPRRILSLNEFLKRAQKQVQTVFNIQVKSYEVTLNQDKKRAIDWNLINKGTAYSNPLKTAFKKANNINSGENSLWNLTGTYTGKDGNSEAVLQMLETYGDVELVSQPSLMARNGIPAQVKAVDKFKVVDGFQQDVAGGGTNGVISVVPKFSDTSVGVTLNVTARLLDDNKIQLDIWPVLSAITGYDQFTVNGFSFTSPKISLEEYSTQVIIENGQTIQLGGLITKKLTKALESLPATNGWSKQMLKEFAGKVSNQLERREIVMLVKASIAEGV